MAGDFHTRQDWITLALASVSSLSVLIAAGATAFSTLPPLIG